MTQFIYQDGGNTEAQQNLALSFLLAQDSPGLATDGVLTGLVVSQTATASASVVITKGAGVAQSSLLAGASLVVLDADLTLDVLTANPVGGLPRNDIVVFDAATTAAGTGGVRVLVGTPNASPTDPTIPASAVPLARLRHAASATTVPTAKIDSLRVITSLFGGPFVKATPAKSGKRIHWGHATITPGPTGYATITHGAGFTPAEVVCQAQQAYFTGVDQGDITATNFIVRLLNTSGVTPGTATIVSFVCYE